MKANKDLNAGNLTFSNCGTSTFNTWNDPIFIESKEVRESIEFIYTETSMISYTIHPSPQPERRTFKIIYSCKDGKWNKSDRIYGEIISAQDESYEFEQ